MKSNHWFKLRYSCVLNSFQRVMKQKCSESSHIWVAWELKCFWIRGNPDGPGFPAWRHVILSQLFRASPRLSRTRDQASRPPGMSPGFCFLVDFPWFPHLESDSSSSLVVCKWLCQVKALHSGVQVGNYMEIREQKISFSVRTFWEKITKEKVKYNCRLSSLNPERESVFSN